MVVMPVWITIHGFYMMPQFVHRHFLLTIVLLVLISRLPTLYAPILDIDEADFAVQTAVWMDGGIPYVDFVEKKTLLIHTWFRSIFEIFGVYNMVAVHVMTALLILGTIAGVYYFARYTSGEKVARWAAILYAFFQSFYDLNDFLSANTETLMNLFAIFGAYLFFKSMREDRPGMSLVAGTLIGMSILAKQVGAVILPACAVSMIWFWYEQKIHRWRRYAEEFFLLFVGVLFPITLHVAYVIDAGGASGFIRWTWFENVAYATAGVDFMAFIARAAFQGGKFIAVTWALWALAAWAVVYFARRHRWRVEVVFHVAWIAFIIPAVSLGGRFFIHYFLQFLPPLVILAAIGIVERWDFFLRSRRMTKRGRRAARIAAALIVLVIPYVVFFVVHFVEIGKVQVKTLPVRNVAAYVKAHTETSDRIFVWGHNSDIYFYSDRKPASRFIYCSYLTGIKEGYEKKGQASGHQQDLDAWVMMRDDFHRHPPRVIVDLAPTDWRGYSAFPLGEQLFLANYVRDNYKKQKTVEGADIYFRK